ncbi:MAG: hypothetical protein AAFP70_11560, partial [Calditrichota bacterium]
MYDLKFRQCKANEFTRLFYLLVFSFFILTSSLLSQDKLDIQGHFTQSYAKSDGNQIFGIPSSGTSDYRVAVMLFQFQADSNNSVHIQFRNRRFGNSPITKLEKSIQLDWGYVQHRFSDNLSLQFGRLLLPIGIYNEIRDKGLELPFFQAPFMPYSEGTFIAKSLDGISLKTSYPFLSSWLVEAAIYTGQLSWTESFRFRNPVTTAVIDFTRNVEMRSLIGGRLWLGDPDMGFRFGGSLLSGDFLFVLPDRGNIEESGSRLTLGLASFDFTRSSFFLRSEYSILREKNINISGYHAQAGIKLLNHLWLNIQQDR